MRESGSGRQQVDLLVEFEHSELEAELRAQGLGARAIERIQAKASGRYYCLKLVFNSRGTVATAEFVTPPSEDAYERREKRIAAQEKARKEAEAASLAKLVAE